MLKITRVLVNTTESIASECNFWENKMNDNNKNFTAVLLFYYVIIIKNYHNNQTNQSLVKGAFINKQTKKRALRIQVNFTSG